MLFHSFPAYSHVFALTLSSLLLLSLPDAASGTQNVTFRFDSSQVSFTTGWRVADFTGSGSVDKFAFANNPGEEVVIQLPQNITALYYRGFKIRGGAQYFACLDCSDTVPSAELTVDGHDDNDNGTQPPDTLFTLPVDPTQTHVLRVINLEDDRFNDSSQITFDSLVLTVNDDDPGVSPSASPNSNSSTSATSTIPSGGDPTATVPVTSTASTVASSAESSSSSASVSQSSTSGSATVGSNSGSSASPTDTASSLSPTSTGSQTQPGRNVTGSGSSLSITATASSNPSSGSSSTSTATSGSEQTSGSSSQNSNSPSNGGISKTVIIVVAVIASVFVLALLAAITWLLIRNQPPPRGDPEGGAGLMREAAPTAMVVSNPLPLSPMRPEIPNPFVDPLDDLIPPPRPAPLPPVPPRSPLRGNFPSDRPAWLTRTPRTPSPESNE